MSADSLPKTKTNFWAMAAAEPFRIFFPIGILFGISGVSLWPLFYLGIHRSFYPGVMHARMMIEGFLGAFIVGFLGTAVPRLLGTRAFSQAELLVLLLPFVSAIGAHIALQPLVGDVLFLLVMSALSTLLICRLRERADLPPPSFVLVGLGLVNALAGTGFLIVGAMKPVASRANLLGSMLLYQGFVLNLILGIGGFFLPRFQALPESEFPEDRRISPEWGKHAAIGLVCGLLILGTFGMEALSAQGIAAYLLRWITASIYLLWNIPFYRVNSKSTLARVIRTGLALLILGLALPVFWPTQRVGALHFVFVGGFTVITFAVATRMVLGHSGNRHRFATPIRPLGVAAFLIVIAAVLRTLGDHLSLERLRFLNWAAYLWMIAALFWASRILPLVRIPDPE